MTYKIIVLCIALMLMASCSEKEESKDNNEISNTEESYVPPIGNEESNSDASQSNNTADVQAMNTPQNPITMPTKKLTDTDLKKLAKIITELQKLNMQSQEMMMAAVQKQGMDPQRFLQIQQSLQNPQAANNLSADEKKKFENSMNAIGEIQVEIRKKMEGALKKEKVSMDEYQEMMMAIQTDQNAQQKLMQMTAPQTPPAPKK
ncbi:MAG: hypothetical protein R2863_10260 [Candidatus Kapaibacterium sp.]|nr:hypothetical protein [Ignavibacteriota bacterium]